MSKYRARLPQLDGGVFLTDGGLETTLIFHDGIDLPLFAAFDLLKTKEGHDRLRSYFKSYIDIAHERGTGFILESATWRASPVWGEQLGYSKESLAKANHEAIALLAELRDAQETEQTPIVVSACIGPQCDGYNPKALLTADESEAYHGFQINVFAKSDADQVSALTMTHTGEAIGIARAAKAANIPCVISFTVETDGKLPTGQSLQSAIEEVDNATGKSPVYYMINCAHPSHFEDSLEEAPWMSRIQGIRANASRASHAELDEATELDDGDPVEFGKEYQAFVKRFPHLNILGGCCSTDHRHLHNIAQALR